MGNKSVKYESIPSAPVTIQRLNVQNYFNWSIVNPALINATIGWDEKYKNQVAVRFETKHYHIKITAEATIEDVKTALVEHKAVLYPIIGARSRRPIDEKESFVKALCAETCLYVQINHCRYLLSVCKNEENLKLAELKYTPTSLWHVCNIPSMAKIREYFKVIRLLPTLPSDEERKHVFCDDARLFGCLTYIKEQQPHVTGLLKEQLDWGESKKCTPSKYFERLDEYLSQRETMTADQRKKLLATINTGCRLIELAERVWSFKVHNEKASCANENAKAYITTLDSQEF